jgi:hypothetical protein
LRVGKKNIELKSRTVRKKKQICTVDFCNLYFCSGVTSGVTGIFDGLQQELKKNMYITLDVIEACFDSVNQTEQFTARSNGGIIVTGVEVLGSSISELVTCTFGCCFED